MNRRTKDMDPDYRREPKTNRYCVRCQKDIGANQGARRVWTPDGQWHMVVHPEDVIHGDVAHLIGSDCAKKIGLEWTE